MPGYIAFLRGIAPTNPNMRNENLRRVFGELGFTNAQTVISSGNVVFDSDSDDVSAMQTQLEQAWQERLGFTSTTIIWSKEQVERLVAADPFQGLEHGPATYLLTTFFQDPPAADAPLPTVPEGPYRLLGFSNDALCTATDTTTVKTPDMMSWIERQYGKRISSRTWKTVHRILAKLV